MQLESIQSLIITHISSLNADQLTQLLNECVNAMEPIAKRKDHLLSEIIKYDVMFELARKGQISDKSRTV